MLGNIYFIYCISYASCMSAWLHTSHLDYASIIIWNPCALKVTGAPEAVQ